MNNPSGTTPSEGTRPGWNQFRWVVAAVLFTAAVSKIVNMPQILAGGGLLGTMPRLLSAAAFEAAAATCLIVGNRFWSWLLTLLTFTVFILSAFFAVATHQSCDCFGKRLEPESMVVIDTVVLLLTAFMRPKTRQPAGRLLPQLTTVAVAGVLVAGAGYWRYEGVMTSERSKYLVVGRLLGNPWPITADLHPRLSELSSGRWMVLVILQDCEHCRDMVDRYFSDPQRHRAGERTAVFLFARDTQPWRFQFDRVTLDEPMDGLLKWPNGEPRVVNPAVFLLDNGIVVDAAEGTASDPFLSSLLAE